MAKLILGLCGQMACGKGTIAQYVTDKKNGSSHRFSTMLRDVLDRLFIEQSRDNLQNISTVLRQTFGEDILAKVMFHEVNNDPHEIVVVDGVRRLSDIVHLKENPSFKLIYVEVSMEARYSRIMARHENTDDSKKTFEQFVEAHKNEAESQILELKDHSDLVLDNNGTLEELYQKVDQIIANNLK